MQEAEISETEPREGERRCSLNLRRFVVCVIFYIFPTGKWVSLTAVIREEQIRTPPDRFRPVKQNDLHISAFPFLCENAASVPFRKHSFGGKMMNMQDSTAVTIVRAHINA